MRKKIQAQFSNILKRRFMNFDIFILLFEKSRADRPVHLKQGRIQRFRKGLALCVGHHGWLTKKILVFRWSKKAKITLETIGFWQNISISILTFSSIFIYNGSLPMKSYQVSKICKRFDKERVKTLMKQSVRKERLGKVELCFITGCFIKSFKGTLMQI